jgi:hypothetical protein
MPSAVALDPREARPLTSREISKVVCSIIAGVVAYDQDAREVVPDVIKAVRESVAMEEINAIAQRRIRNGHPRPDYVSVLSKVYLGPSWACALIGTVAGLRGWCAPKDVDTALAWVAENLELVFPPPGPN